MNRKPLESLKHFDWPSTLQSYLLLTLGALLLAVNVNLFLAPPDIAPGGVSGSALVINHFTGWPIGLTMLALNLPLIAVGFRYLGRFQFLSKTLYVVLIYNVGTDLLRPWLPNGITHDLVLNAICGGALGGIATGLVYRSGGTSAGSGIISRVLQIKTGIPLSQMYLFTDGAIIFVEGLVFGWDKALYSLIMLFLWGLATDYTLEGPSVVRTVFVVTEQAGEVSHALLTRLQVGVTAWSGQGMFTEAERKVLFCTINRPDVNAVRAIVTEIDPDAFVVIGQGHQASGGVLRSDIRKLR
jgi:uncharacterized membrane-anchored protein YitT (DUF2179 family)